MKCRYCHGTMERGTAPFHIDRKGCDTLLGLKSRSFWLIASYMRRVQATTLARYKRVTILYRRHQDVP